MTNLASNYNSYLEFQAKKVTMNAGVNSIVLDEKMQKRKERFGL